MKKIILIASILLVITKITAQKVYSVNSEFDADVKIFVLNSEFDADLLVYKVKSEFDAGKNNGKWFFTKSEFDAKWRDNSKMYLMY